MLLVEDNVDARETLRELLEMMGHQVHTAEEGFAAVRMALDLRPEVALIDIGLPGLDGYEVARRIRAAEASLQPVTADPCPDPPSTGAPEASGRAPGRHPQSNRLFLIALTGYGQPEDRERALAVGFDAHMVKPLQTADLTRLLASL